MGTSETDRESKARQTPERPEVAHLLPAGDLLALPDLLAEGRERLSQKRRSFRTTDELLAWSGLLLDLARLSLQPKASGRNAEVEALAGELREQLHRRLECSSKKVPLAALLRAHELHERELEIVLLLTATTLRAHAVGRQRGGLHLDELVTLFARTREERVALMRQLSPEGRLASLDLITRVRSEGSPSLLVPTYPVHRLAREGRKALEEREESVGAWEITDDAGLLDHLRPLAELLERRLEARRAGGEAPPARELDSRLRQLPERLAATFEKHPELALAQWGAKLESVEELLAIVVLALRAAEPGGAGPMPVQDLATMLARSPQHARKLCEVLGPDGPLVKHDAVRVTARGRAERASAAIELTPMARRCLGLEPLAVADGRAREARVRLEQLVLPEAAEEALRLAVAQARHHEVLTETWGLGAALPYGRAMTLLLWGPAGTGKTAAAEAIAHELGRPFMPVRYDQLVGGIAGETEKAIAAAFRQAQEAGAVLFWDEADALFTDRSNLRNGWEVRDVNVLLVELERFDGLCVLATNRPEALDAALERRIAVSVELPAPDREQRLEIWRRLVPEQMPIADDVDFEALAELELTGGDIKNVLLNAARRALTRGPDSTVTADDFEQTLARREGPNPPVARRIGFAPTEPAKGA